jgi:hypothetical protein
MQSARLVPAILSALILGAHLMRAGWGVFAWMVAALPLLLLSGKRWAVVGLQVALAAGALEWLRTLDQLVVVRRAHGQSFGRLVAILISVATLSALSVYLLEIWRRTRERNLTLRSSP